MGKASKERARQEYREVKDHMYKTRGSDDNPYPEGSRKYRFWEKAHRYYWQMEFLLGHDD